MKNKIFLLIILAILFLAVPYLVNFIVLTPSSIGFITPDEQETWIGFYGSLSGGVLTLLGVRWTIKYTNAVRKEDQEKHEEEIKKEYEKRDLEIKRNLSMQYKPILTISFNQDFIEDESFGVSTYKGYYIQNNISLVDIKLRDEKKLVINLLALNIGRGEARKLKISSSVTSADGEIWETVTREYEEICKSNGINLCFCRNLNDKEWERYENKILEKPVQMIFKIDYIDLVGYQHSLEGLVSIKRFIYMKNKKNELNTNVIVLNPYDSIIQNTTSSSELYI